MMAARLSKRGNADWSLYTVSQLAKVAGVSRPTYYKLENDTSLLTNEQAEALAEYLGCEASSFFARPRKR